jgi:uncharacterized protein YcbK (DUF882 family)
MVSLIDRRRLCAGAVAAAALPAVAAQAETNNSGANDWLPPKWRELGFPSRRWVNIIFVHTNERFKNIYCEAGEYIVPAVKQFSWTCRDYRRGEWEWIHPMLLDLLFVLHWKYNKDEINIFSGYRTPETNANIEGAALNSQHTLAKALDIHLPNTDNAAVAEDFKRFIYGGVGMYPLKHFTHLDCGPLRSWVG